MRPQTSPSTPESALYRRVWRWHFYAGLICLPFLAILALTGALYLFKEPIDSVVYAKYRLAPTTSALPLDAETLVAKAQAAHAGHGCPLRGAA